MTARIRDKESRFKAGKEIQLPEGPLRKRLTYSHCCALEVGERIWLTTSKAGVFLVATVTKVSTRSIGTEVSYAAGSSSSGHFTAEPSKAAQCYRFLDEDVIAPNAAEKQPVLRLVGKN